MIKAVIFDIDGVVVDFSWKRYFDYKANELKLDRNRFADVFLPMKERWDLGRITLNELERSVASKMNISKKNIAVLGSFRKLAKPNREVRSLIFGLSKKYKVALLTNVGLSRYMVERKRYINGLPLSCIVASCYLKVKKPSPGIYLYALRKMKIAPNEAIFIDDNEKNILAARKIGIDSIIFTSCKKLMRDLRKRNVLE